MLYAETLLEFTHERSGEHQLTHAAAQVRKEGVLGGAVRTYHLGVDGGEHLVLQLGVAVALVGEAALIALELTDLLGTLNGVFVIEVGNVLAHELKRLASAGRGRLEDFLQQVLELLLVDVQADGVLLLNSVARRDLTVSHSHKFVPAQRGARGTCLESEPDHIHRLLGHDDVGHLRQRISPDNHPPGLPQAQGYQYLIHQSTFSHDKQSLGTQP